MAVKLSLKLPTLRLDEKVKTVFLSLLLILIVLASCTSPKPSVILSPSVHFIDVGQGDSILIDIGETEILIDGGDKSPGVVNYISNYVDGALEVMIATHPHEDHIGGLMAVLDRFKVKEIWLNGDTSTSKIFTDFIDLVNAEKATIHSGL